MLGSIFAMFPHFLPFRLISTDIGISQSDFGVKDSSYYQCKIDMPVRYSMDGGEGGRGEGATPHFSDSYVGGPCRFENGLYQGQ